MNVSLYLYIVITTYILQVGTCIMYIIYRKAKAKDKLVINIILKGTSK